MKYYQQATDEELFIVNDDSNTDSRYSFTCCSRRCTLLSLSLWLFLCLAVTVGIVIGILFLSGVFDQNNTNNNLTNWNLYRPTFHFVPLPENWMNDPCGPFYDNNTGYYHLFYQYNTPRVWGHAVSEDLLSWQNLPIAINNSEIYNKGGVWTGSVTQLNNGSIYAMYSVSTNNMICLAQPDNTSSMLINWINYDDNCIINTSKSNANISIPYGRDPTTSWLNPIDNNYYFAYGIATNNGSGGAASLWKTDNWKNWSMVEGTPYLAYSTIGGVWECPDFFEFPESQRTADITHAFKMSIGTVSSYVEGTDVWILGTYDTTTNQFLPINNGNNTNNLNNLMNNLINSSAFDYGQHFYASKSFYDAKNDRQLLYGWILEERDINAVDMNKHNDHGTWAGVMSLPQEIQLLPASSSPTGDSRIITNIITEFDNEMHINESKYVHKNLSILNGSNYYIDISSISGNNLDIKLYDIIGSSFSINSTQNNSISYECGIYVLCDGDKQQEYTKIGLLFGEEGKQMYYINTTKSTLNNNLTNYVGETDAIIHGWNGINKIDNVRIIIDNSIIIVYINNGITVQTRRVYPTLLDSSVQIGFWAYNDNCTIGEINAWNIKNANEN